ncbi:ORF22 [Ranid herpesvirus 1]|uniref:ORF22 n=1 Tax=Ranid herpesvirus 1 TaxID=85655 RepID=Q14VT6_9VIRU|nr:ORF22 [Ranid herpesvirus 1]ABG25788.1 ORF22 [Ranid herpesvirus 1]
MHDPILDQPAVLRFLAAQLTPPLTLRRGVRCPLKIYARAYLALQLLNMRNSTRLARGDEEAELDYLMMQSVLAARCYLNSYSYTLPQLPNTLQRGPLCVSPLHRFDLLLVADRLAQCSTLLHVLRYCAEYKERVSEMDARVTRCLSLEIITPPTAQLNSPPLDIQVGGVLGILYTKLTGDRPTVYLGRGFLHRALYKLHLRAPLCSITGVPHTTPEPQQDAGSRGNNGDLLER